MPGGPKGEKRPADVIGGAGIMVIISPSPSDRARPARGWLTLFSVKAL
jgi:hypothetical protein